MINSWDGDDTGDGPDIWSVEVENGPSLLHTTFSNIDEFKHRQSYPDNYPGGSYPAQTGALEQGTLGYTYYGNSVYRFSYTFNHQGTNLVVRFTGAGLQSTWDESWGLDNVVVNMLVPVEGRMDTPCRSGEILLGDTLRFTGHAVAGSDQKPLRYLWNFGDARSSDLEDPGLISFPVAGSKTITLDVWDKRGQHDETPEQRTLVVVDKPGAMPDLAVLRCELPASLLPYQPAAITYVAQNAGDAIIDGGKWADAIYLSSDPYLSTEDRQLSSREIQVALAPGASYTNSLAITVPPLEEGAYYLIISLDDRWQVLERRQLNNEYATLVDLSVPKLTHGTSVNGQFAASVSSQYYRIDVPPGQNLLIQLDNQDAKSVCQVFARLGSLPTRSVYDAQNGTAQQADPQLLIPGAASGAWYIMVYGESGGGSGLFSLRAEASQLKVTSVAPTAHSNGPEANQVVLTLTGAGFGPQTTVELAGPGGVNVPAGEVLVDSYTQLTAVYSLVGVPPGVYRLRVSQSGGQVSVLPNAFTVLEGGEAKLETRVIVPSSIGRAALATLYIEYANTGQASMPAPLLVLTGTDHPLLSLDKSRLTSGFWTSANPEGFQESIQVLASGATPGILQPGELMQVPVYFVGLRQPWNLSDNRVDFSLGVLQAGDCNPVDWTSLKSALKPSTVADDAWEMVWAGFVAQTGSTWGDYVRMLADNAAYLGRLGERVIDVSALLAFELLQADGLYPQRTLTSSADAALEAPGLPLVFNQFFPQGIAQRFVLGPLGKGWTHNWQYSLEKLTDGTVVVHGPAGSSRTFQPDRRKANRYFSPIGDHGTLAQSADGGYVLTEASGFSTSYRADGNLQFIQDLNGNRITAIYSGPYLVHLRHSSGQFLQINYTASGRIQSLVDSLGRQTLFAYDPAGEHLLEVEFNDGRKATYTYGTGLLQHALIAVDASGLVRRQYAYDPQGRLSATFLGDQEERIDFTHDAAGRVTAADALGHSSHFYFDHRGLLVKTENALGQAVHMDFDQEYNLTRLTDADGRSYRYRYDQNGQLAQQTDPLGHATQFAYQGPWQKLSSVLDANGNLTSYDYTTNGNLQSIIYADGSQEGWHYDAWGNPTTWTNRRGRALEYTYDTSGRLLEKSYADGTSAVYTYDARGNLTRASTLNTQGQPQETATMRYDAQDRLTRIEFTGSKWLRFGYDAAGRRISSLDQIGHRLTYQYDVAGRLCNMSNELGQLVVNYRYDPAGRLELKTLGNGMTARYGYDAAGQVLTLTNRLASGTSISWFNYTYDNRGRRTSMDTHYGKWSYAYDDLGQLIRAVLVSTDPEVPHQDLTYVYDPLGNRIRTIENGVTTEYTSNNLNQYLKVGSTNFVFDLDGNLIQEIAPTGTTTYTYNDENRLIAVHKGSDQWQYVYDALGNRVVTKENGVIKRFVIDPIGLGNVVGEYDATHSFAVNHTYGYGLVSQSDAENSPAYYFFDANGNVQQLIRSSNKLANDYRYDPFGILLLVKESIPSLFQFSGQNGVTSEGCGIDFMHTRFYIESQGRFASIDPVQYRGGSINLVSYAGNNAVSFIDPSGLAYFYKWDVICPIGPPMMNPIDDQLNLELVHEQIIFDDGSNLGYGTGKPGKGDHFLTGKENGLFWKESLPFFKIKSSEHFEDSLLRKAIAIVTERGMSLASKYELTPFFGKEQWNCQNWAEAVRNEYYRLDLEREIASSLVAASDDPNAKIGPAGFGASGYVNLQTVLPYRIDFENMTNATAPAQEVTVSDPLSANLDWSTFQISELGFGDQLVVVPPNTSYLETNLAVNILGSNFVVQIEAGLNFMSGQAYAHFRSIDPTTGLPPAVQIGFLPPEDGTGRGQGHFTFLIKPRAGLNTGAQIRNVAQISFDNQTRIATNQRDPHNPGAGTDPAKECLNTIDAGAPSSQVQTLGTSVIQASFPVQWTGQDDANGSGVAAYDVYVAVDRGPWTLWQVSTTNTSAIYPGTVGHRYAFYSIAQDNVGNREDPPLEADTATQVTTIGLTDLALLTDTYDVIGTGSNWVQTIVVTNQGPGFTQGVVLTNKLGAGVAVVSMQTGQGTLNQKGSVITGRLEAIPPGGSITLQFVYSNAKPGTVKNTITVGGTMPELDVRNNSAQSTTVFASGPQIATLTPVKGPAGTVITVTGKNFLGTSSVQVNGLDVLYDVVSATTIKVLIPLDSTGGQIKVATPVGEATSSVVFQVTPAGVASRSLIMVPEAGPGGTAIALSAPGVGRAKSVLFGLSPAKFTRLSDDQIHAIVPVGALSGVVTVSSAEAFFASAERFMVLPAITGLTPAKAGAIGAPVTIAGTGFRDVSSVQFNGVPAVFTVASPTSIKTYVPAQAVSGPVAVVTREGRAISAFSFAITPAIQSFYPVAGTVGSDLILTGLGLANITAAQIGGVPASFSLISPSILMMTVPNNGISGIIRLQGAGGSVASKAAFKVLPAIMEFAPSRGLAGETVTIRATGTGGLTTVVIGGAKAAFVVTNGVIRALVPAKATNGPVSLVTTSGTTSSTQPFQVIPQIKSFSPAKGAPKARITISGSGFVGATGVLFSEVAAVFKVVSANSIQTTVPTNATTGPITVITPSGRAVSTNAFTVMVVKAAADQPILSLEGEETSPKAPDLAAEEFSTTPQLSITREIDGLALWWPAWAKDYQLEAAYGFESTVSWVPIPEMPELVGEHYRVIIRQSQGSSLFRLRRVDSEMKH